MENSLSRWRIAATVFRSFELCLALLFLFWISARLPLAAHICFHYLRLALSFASRPLVVFFLSNAILAAVVAKPGTPFSSSWSTDDCSVDGFYGEIINLNESRPRSRHLLEDEGVTLYHEKDIILSETNGLVPASFNDYTSDSDTEPEGDPKTYLRRTQSEKYSDRRKWREEDEEDVEDYAEEVAKGLRRSETMKCRSRSTAMTTTCEKLPEMRTPEDELSSEEFQRTIEAFIAKQLRFRREESMAIALHSH